MLQTVARSDCARFSPEKQFYCRSLNELIGRHGWRAPLTNSTTVAVAASTFSVAFSAVHSALFRFAHRSAALQGDRMLTQGCHKRP